MFASREEQANIIKSIEESLPSLTPFQKRQYERTIEALKDDKSANLQMVLIPSTAGWEDGIEDQSKIFPPPAEGAPWGLTGAICLQYPLSRGTVHIKSSDPTDHPRLDPAYLAHPADAAVLAAGVQVCA